MVRIGIVGTNFISEWFMAGARRTAGRVEPVAAVSQENGGLRQVTVTHEIIVRQRGDLMSGMRFVTGARRFLVQAAHDPDEGGRYLLCRCAEEGR